MIAVQTTFTANAEKLLEGESGLFKFTYTTYPNIGDKLTVKTSPSGKVLTFVCIERRFDFSSVEEPQLALHFDVCL